jgi:uncharacterized damage-inducible protein DinB
MNEKDMYLQALEREVGTTLRVLRAYPRDRENLKPDGDKLRTAKELAWVFVLEGQLTDGALAGAMKWDSGLSMSGSITEIIDRYEKMIKEQMKKISAMPDSDWNGQMETMVGPGKTANVRRADIFWIVLHDMIHHRGQFSIYLRMAGGKVPSIYGPSGDEPWT